MMYHYLTLDDGTEINHSELKEDDTVKIYIEQPIEGGFKSVSCVLPNYNWKDNDGFSTDEINKLDDILHSVSHIIIQLAKEVRR